MDELVAVVEATTGTTQIENMPAQSAEKVSLSLPRMTRTPTTKTTKRKESQYCKKVNIDTYSSTNKDQDLVIWVNQFEEAVKQQLNPHSKKRHHKQCLKWLTLSLASDAYSIWQRTDHNRTDWVLLRAELEEAFEDTEVRSHWKSNMKAYTWDEKQPLREYRAKVERYVDTFDKALCLIRSSLFRITQTPLPDARLRD